MLYQTSGLVLLVFYPRKKINEIKANIKATKNEKRNYIDLSVGRNIFGQFAIVNYITWFKETKFVFEPSFIHF